MRSCHRHIRVTIVDTVTNYVLQTTKEKRQVCGSYGYTIKARTITYNVKHRKMEKLIIHYNNLTNIQSRNVTEYRNNANHFELVEIKKVLELLDDFWNKQADIEDKTE